MGLNGSSGEVADLRRAAQSVTGALDDYESLLSSVADRRLVLIGEASHGTHELYRERARLTRRLIDDLGFRGGRGRGLAGCLSSEPVCHGNVG